MFTVFVLVACLMGAGVDGLDEVGGIGGAGPRHQALPGTNVPRAVRVLLIER